MGDFALPLTPESNDEHQQLLEKIQGNILRPHGRNFTRLVLLRFNNPKPDTSRSALSALAGMGGRRLQPASPYADENPRMCLTATDRGAVAAGTAAFCHRREIFLRRAQGRALHFRGTRGEFRRDK